LGQRDPLRWPPSSIEGHFSDKSALGHIRCSDPHPMLKSERNRAAMNPIQLVEKLRAIERALELEERSTIRTLVAEALQYAMQMQRESPEQMRRDSRAVQHT